MQLQQHLHVSQLCHSIIPHHIRRHQLLLHVARALQRGCTQRQVIVDVGLQRRLSLAQPLRQLRHVRIQPLRRALHLLPEQTVTEKQERQRHCTASSRLLVVTPLQLPRHIFFSQNFAQLLHLKGGGGGGMRVTRTRWTAARSNLQLQ